MNTGSRFYTVLFTFIYTFVFIFFLTFVYLFARDIINTNQTLFQKRALLNAMNIEYESDSDAVNKYSKMIRTKEAGDITVYSADVDGTEVHLIIFTGKGLWGTIQGALSVNGDVTRIIGLDIITHAETPGLGGRIEENWFLEQFRNEKIGSDGISFQNGEGSYVDDDMVVDSITGATRTSEALQGMINETLATFEKLKTEGAL